MTTGRGKPGHGASRPAAGRAMPRLPPAGVRRGMAKYEVQGGVALRGTIRASGAKNAATKQMVAALLSTEESVLRNVPKIGDIEITSGILRSVGARVEW